MCVKEKNSLRANTPLFIVRFFFMFYSFCFSVSVVFDVKKKSLRTTQLNIHGRRTPQDKTVLSMALLTLDCRLLAEERVVITTFECPQRTTPRPLEHCKVLREPRSNDSWPNFSKQAASGRLRK